MARLGDPGIDIDEVANELTMDGLRSFAKAYDHTHAGIAEKMRRFGTKDRQAA